MYILDLHDLVKMEFRCLCCVFIQWFSFTIFMKLACFHIGHGSPKRRATHRDSDEMHMLLHEEERVSPVSLMMST